MRPDDPSALASAMMRLRGRSAAEREAMGQRGHAYVLAHHDYAVLARQFLDVLNGAIAPIAEPNALTTSFQDEPAAAPRRRSEGFFAGGRFRKAE